MILCRDERGCVYVSLGGFVKLIAKPPNLSIRKRDLMKSHGRLEQINPPEPVESWKTNVTLDLYILSPDSLFSRLKLGYVLIRVSPSIEKTWVVETPFGPLKRFMRYMYKSILFRRLHEWAFRTRTPVTPPMRVEARVLRFESEEDARVYSWYSLLSGMPEDTLRLHDNLRIVIWKTQNLILKPLREVWDRLKNRNRVAALYFSYIPAFWAACKERGLSFKRMWEVYAPALLYIACVNCDVDPPLEVDPEILVLAKKAFPMRS